MHIGVHTGSRFGQWVLNWFTAVARDALKPPSELTSDFAMDKHDGTKAAFQVDCYAWF